MVSGLPPSRRRCPEARGSSENTLLAQACEIVSVGGSATAITIARAARRKVVTILLPWSCEAQDVATSELAACVGPWNSGFADMCRARFLFLQGSRSVVRRLWAGLDARRATETKWRWPISAELRAALPSTDFRLAGLWSDW